MTSVFAFEETSRMQNNLYKRQECELDEHAARECSMYCIIIHQLPVFKFKNTPTLLLSVYIFAGGLEWFNSLIIEAETAIQPRMSS